MANAKEKFEYVMREWKDGKLRTSAGHKVAYPSGKRQALAIAYSEARSIDESYGMRRGGIARTRPVAYEVPFVYLGKRYKAVWNIPASGIEEAERKFAEQKKLRMDFDHLLADYFGVYAKLDRAAYEKEDEFLDALEEGVRAVVEEGRSKGYDVTLKPRRDEMASGGEIKRFDRHKYMDMDILSEIGDIISEIRWDDKYSSLVNSLYGLYDGYDYSNQEWWIESMEKLKSEKPELHKRIIFVYEKVSKYPSGITQVERGGSTMSSGGGVGQPLLLDDLKANFRSWEIDSDNEHDANRLVAILVERHPEEKYETIKEWAYHWVGYEPKTMASGGSVEKEEDLPENFTKENLEKDAEYKFDGDLLELYWEAYDQSEEKYDKDVYREAVQILRMNKFMELNGGKKFLVDFGKWAARFNNVHNQERYKEIVDLGKKLGSDHSAKFIYVNTNGPVHFFMEFANGEKHGVNAHSVPELNKSLTEVAHIRQMADGGSTMASGGGVGNWEVVKYKGEWAVYDKESRAYVLFGTKKRMEERARELNSSDKFSKGGDIEYRYGDIKSYTITPTLRKKLNKYINEAINSQLEPQSNIQPDSELDKELRKHFGEFPMDLRVDLDGDNFFYLYFDDRANMFIVQVVMKPRYMSSSGGSMSSGGGTENLKLSKLSEDLENAKKEVERFKWQLREESKGEHEPGDFADRSDIKEWLRSAEYQVYYIQMQIDQIKSKDSMARGGGVYSIYANGGQADDKKKLQDQIAIISSAIESEDTPERTRKSMQEKLEALEVRLAQLEVPVQASAPKPETPSQRKSVVMEGLQAEEALGKVRARIDGRIRGRFEGTIQPEGSAPIEVSEDVSVDVKREKPQRNVSIPENRRMYVDIEEKYRHIVRNTLNYKDIKFTSKSIGGMYRVFVDSKEKVDKIIKLYNQKRVKRNDVPVDASQVTGEYKKGGKLLAKQAMKKKSFRRKIAKMKTNKNK